jgi:hypothetical protein
MKLNISTRKGFTMLRYDIAPTLVAVLQTKFGDNPNIKVICDFLSTKEYDLLLNKRFLLPYLLPTSKYVWKMHQL